MDADGSNPIRIADETVATSPQCSPDGKWAIYLRGASDPDACGDHRRKASGTDCAEAGLDWRCSRVLARRQTDRISRRSAEPQFALWITTK